jgi:hypothetical protein
MAAKFQIYKSGTQYRWRLKAGNGEIVASGEAYTSKANCDQAVGWVKQNAAGATVEDDT